MILSSTEQNKNISYSEWWRRRICEATATPETEGANLSEKSNNKRIDLYDI